MFIRIYETCDLPDAGIFLSFKFGTKVDDRFYGCFAGVTYHFTNLKNHGRHQRSDQRSSAVQKQHLLLYYIPGKLAAMH